MASVSSTNWYADREITVTWRDYFLDGSGTPAWESGQLAYHSVSVYGVGTVSMPSLFTLSDALAWQAGPDINPHTNYTRAGDAGRQGYVDRSAPGIGTHDNVAYTTIKVADSSLIEARDTEGNYGLCYVVWIRAGADLGDINLKQVMPVTISATNPLIVDGVYEEPGGLWTIRHGTPPTEAELTVDDVLIGDAVTEATIAPNVNQTYTYQWNDEDERKIRIVAGVNDHPMKHQIAGPQRKGDTIWRP